MPSTRNSGAKSAPPIVLQADQVRRRIVASDAVAALVAELAFGPTRRGDLVALAGLTADRVGGGAH